MPLVFHAARGAAEIFQDLSPAWSLRRLGTMEVQFTHDTEKKLKELAAQSGRGTDDLVEDATAAYVDELLQARQTLDSRYDDIRSGRVKLIPGEEAFAQLRAKSAAHRAKSQ